MTACAPCKLLSCALGALLSTALSSELARAEPPETQAVEANPAASPDAEAVARERYDAGAKAYADGDYATAIQRFLEADRVLPSPALSFNIARAYEKLGDPAQALRFYRDYLRRAPRSEDAARVQRTVRSLEGVLAMRGVQQFTVLSVPAGARGFIDGQSLGTTPFTAERAPGAHHLTLRLKGYRNRDLAFVLPAEHALDLTLTMARDEPASKRPAAATSGAASRNRTLWSSSNGDGSADRGNGGDSALRTWGFIGIGAGSAALATALTYEILRRNAEHQAESARTQLEYAEDYDRMQNRKTWARVFAGTGTALLLTGGALISIDLLNREKQERDRKVSRVSIGCEIHGCSATWNGKF